MFFNVYERKNQIHICLICGGRYTTANKAQHEISNKHRKAVEQNAVNNY